MGTVMLEPTAATQTLPSLAVKVRVTPASVVVVIGEGTTAKTRVPLVVKLTSSFALPVAVAVLEATSGTVITASVVPAWLINSGLAGKISITEPEVVIVKVGSTGMTATGVPEIVTMDGWMEDSPAGKGMSSWILWD